MSQIVQCPKCAMKVAEVEALQREAGGAEVSRLTLEDACRALYLLALGVFGAVWAYILLEGY
jgi:hypothetical protein